MPLGLSDLSTGESIAAGSTVAIILTFFGNLIWGLHARATRRIDKLEIKLDKCQEEHAECREEAAAHRKALEIVSHYAGPIVKEKVEQTLAIADEKVQAVKEAKKNGDSHPPKL